MNKSRPDRTHDTGFILPLLGLLLIPLVVFTAIGIDISSWYSRATELQRTADAAALAGVVWTPEINKARDEATPVLARNGIANGVDGMTVTMDYGEDGNTSFKVCVTDTEVTQFFAAVFASPTKLTRCSTAQYNAPLQLGSPLNYFGGNHEMLSEEIPGPLPANAYAPVPSKSAFGSDRYCWVNEGGVTVGYWDNRNNSNTANWYYWPYPENGLGGSHPNCGTGPPALPNMPEGSGCNVPGSSNGYWYRDGSGSFPSGWRYRNRNYNTGRDCTYGGETRTPIPSEKSPNFWAAIEGYNNSHANGDAFTTKGDEHRDTGYWYSVDIPEGVQAGDLSIQIWDLSYNCDAGCRSPMGDDTNNGHTRTKAIVSKAGPLKYDMSDLDPIAGCDTGWQTSSSGSTTYNLRWAEICNIGSPSPGDRYYINVLANDTDGKTGGGYNGYAVRAVAGTFPAECLDTMPHGNVACYGTGVQPRLSAYGDMEMYNGIDSGQPTQFFLADVVPTYAGKTLVVDLFDPGDGTGSSWVSIRGPSTTTVDGSPVSGAECTVEWRKYGSDTWHPAPLSDGPSSTNIYNDTCTVQTRGGTSTGTCRPGTSNRYNDCWLRFKIDLPASYGPSGTESWTKCDPTVADPVTTAGSCWWQISYFLDSGRLDDYTTWSARVIGDPVRLTH